MTHRHCQNRQSLSRYDRPLRVEPLEDRRMLAAFPVTNLLDGPVTASGQLQGSLRQAIFDANARPGADEITFESVTGTIALTAGELQITDELTIAGPGQTEFVIDAQQQSRIFNITTTYKNVTISGLAATNGRTTGGGGGILSQTFALTLNQVTVSNSSSVGGGGGVSANYLVMNDCQIVQNFTTGLGARGGGVWAAFATITDTSIVGNHTEGSGAGGGGLWVSIGSAVASAFPSVLKSTISQNYTKGRQASGGGIQAPGGINISQSSIRDNYTSRDDSAGGGLNTGGDTTINESTFAGNYTLGIGATGGGIYAYEGLIVTQSTISGNNSRGDGGGIFAREDVTVRFTTIANNQSGLRGGGIWAPNHTVVEVSHSIIAGNTATSTHPDLSGLRSSPFGNSSIANYNVIGNTSGLTAEELDLLSAGAGNQLNVDPMLGPLQYNGGITFTRDLLSGSPAINAGNATANAGANNVPLEDQRGPGYSRVFNGRIDIGAVESQPLPGDFDSDGDVDGRDFLAWQRNPGLGSLTAWQTNYGNEELGSRLRENDEMTVQSEEPQSSIAPWAVSSLSATRAGVPRYYHFVAEDTYVAEVDHALEQFATVPTRTHGFGEIVARRGTPKRFDAGRLTPAL